jgi:hypothetical protein
LSAKGVVGVTSGTDLRNLCLFLMWREYKNYFGAIFVDKSLNLDG